MIALLAALLLQDPLAEAERLRELALFDKAEKILRDAIPKSSDGRVRISLLRLLYQARRYDDCIRESEALQGDDSARAFALAMKGACLWKKGEPARETLAEAEKICVAKGYGEILKSVRQTQAFLGWKRHESERLILFYPADSPLGERIHEFGEMLDGAFEKVAKALDAKVDDKIEAYYFNDNGQARKILGVTLNFAAPRDRAFYSLHDATLAHEMAHVISFFVANREGKSRPESRLLNEGLASYLACSRTWDQRIATKPKSLLKDGKLPPIRDILGRKAEHEALYEIGGSFVKFLYETHGKEKFLRFWREYNDHKDAWTAVYGRTLDDLEKDWRGSLDR